MLGQLLDGRYQIVQVLGGGAFGQTFLAKDMKRPGQPVCVVKQLRYIGSNPQGLQIARRLFKKEAEILEKLGLHDQIPTLLADLEENQEFYLVQQYIPGHTLSQEILPGQPWREDKLIELITEVLQILMFVHSQGVIHRDLKPANLMRRSLDNKLVLIDFGAVKEIGTQMMRGQVAPTVVVGTPGYMPLEQFHGQPQFNSDIYALGMLSIQALLGIAASELPKLQNPNNLNQGEMLWRTQAQVSADLADILDKMVQPSYLQRYQSAAEVLADLKKINSNSDNLKPPSQQIPPGPKTEVNQPQKYQRLILIGVTTLIVGGAVAGVLYTQMPQNRAVEFYTRGLEKSKLGDKQGAIAQFNQAIELSPNYAQAYYERAQARYNLADYQGTVEDTIQAIRINPSYAEAYRRRCAAYGNLKNYSAAIEDCTQAIRLDPGNAFAYVNRASTYYSLGQNHKAMADASQAIALDPKLSLAYISRGLVREDLGDRLGAVEDYTQAIQLDANDTRAYINRSNVYRKLGQYREAVADADQVIKLKPNNSLAYYNRGLAHRALGEKQTAIADFQKTAKLCLEQSNSGCYKDAQYLLAQLQKPESNIATQPQETTTNPTTRGNPNPITIAQPESVPRRRRRPKPIKVVQPQPEPSVQTAPQPLIVPKPETESNLQTIPQPKPELESKPEAKSERGPQTVPYRYIRPSPEPEPTTEPEPKTVPQPRIEAQPTADSQPTTPAEPNNGN